ncbi:MAG: hypothetical protein LLG14_19340 [Nocardiaceae bacterium]|nr:hypothetical protein [Nocardiaceae bacterium]
MSREIPSSARGVSREWTQLENARGTGELFETELAADLPPTARRWIIHAIAKGTPLARSARLTMRGSIKIGTWRPFTAIELLVPDTGFIWAATAKVASVPVTGYDRYTGGSGQMRWRLAGVLPVMSAQGRDVTVSALGRLAGESIFVPTTFTSARWTDLDDGVARMTRTIDSQEESIDLEIGEEGELRGARMQRWGNPDGTGFSRRLFTVTCRAERTFDGITIPSQFSTAWGTGEDTEFFRTEIVRADFA